MPTEKCRTTCISELNSIPIHIASATRKGEIISLIIREICEHEPDLTARSVHFSVKALEQILLKNLEAAQNQGEAGRPLVTHWMGYTMVSLRYNGRAGASAEVCLPDQHVPALLLLPDKKPDPGPCAGLTRKWVDGWNDCIDELARLNTSQ